MREKKGEMKVKAFLFIILIEVHDDTESEIEERENNHLFKESTYYSNQMNYKFCNKCRQF